MQNFLQQPAEQTHWEWWQRRKIGRFTDMVFDAMLLRRSARHVISQTKSKCPPQRVLVVGVVVPGREADMLLVQSALSSNIHAVDFSFVEMKPKGKFDNVNTALENASSLVAKADWLIVVDDDISFPSGFVDDSIALLVDNKIDIAQPAHRMFSYTSWRITKRAWGSLIRTTRFVEIGPVTIFSRRTFDQLIPFPSLRWAWGLDPYWSHVAARNKWKMAILDATPIGHLRPVGATYDRAAAEREGDAFLNQKGVTLSREDIMRPGRILRRW